MTSHLFHFGILSIFIASAWSSDAPASTPALREGTVNNVAGSIVIVGVPYAEWPSNFPAHVNAVQLIERVHALVKSGDFPKAVALHLPGESRSIAQGDYEAGPAVAAEASTVKRYYKAAMTIDERTYLFSILGASEKNGMPWMDCARVTQGGIFVDNSDGIDSFAAIAPNWIRENKALRANPLGVGIRFNHTDEVRSTPVNPGEKLDAHGAYLFVQISLFPKKGITLRDLIESNSANFPYVKESLWKKLQTIRGAPSSKDVAEGKVNPMYLRIAPESNGYAPIGLLQLEKTTAVLIVGEGKRPFFITGENTDLLQTGDVQDLLNLASVPNICARYLAAIKEQENK